jgi:hypothetical protein
VPSLAAALQLTTDLLEVLEEVDADTRLQVYESVVLQLSSNCAAIRSQVGIQVLSDHAALLLELPVGCLPPVPDQVWHTWQNCSNLHFPPLAPRACKTLCSLSRLRRCWVRLR